MACLALLAALSAFSRAATQNVRVSPPRPQLTPTGSISVSATPSALSFRLVAGGKADGSAPVTITTKVTNISVLGSLSLYAYFTSASALTSPEGAIIANSRVFAYSDAQPSYQPFTSDSPFAPGTSILVYRTTSLVDVSSAQGHQNVLQLRIDLTGTTQPAGQYTGSLVLQAQAL